MNKSYSKDIGFIGAGTTALALGVRLRDRGYPVKAVASRSYESAQQMASRVDGCQAYSTVQEVVDRCGLVFVTTPDDMIAEIAKSIRWSPGYRVVHCSGAKALDVLEPAREQGAFIGSFHPLQTFGSVEQALENISGSAFALEARPPLLEELQQFADALEGTSLVLPEGSRPLYHASAMMVCGFIVTLAGQAAGLWKSFGFDQSEALQALLPLIEGTVKSLGANGIPDAFTGPLVRGDVGTIQSHLEALKQQAPHLVGLYSQLSLETLELASAKSTLDPESKGLLESLLLTHTRWMTSEAV
jgi:predicted short-subunit dehydrogenase-like oxidoreductase (DUF2520 family)